MERQPIIHFRVSTGKYSSFINQIVVLAKKRSSSIVCVSTVHMFIEAYQDENFSQIINDADIVTPDGVPLTWGLRLLHGIKQERVAGADLLPDLFGQMMKNNLSVYFYGGSQELLEQTNQYLKTKYPNLKIAGLYSPPFRNLTQPEEEEIIRDINGSQASVVFVVLGCPKQERWMASMKGKINAVMIGIGGAIHPVVGLQKRAPKWMQASGLEWLFRLSMEPGRLFKRYAITNSLYLFLIFKEYISMKVIRKAA